jgi:oxalate decarboxylase/phosphoglucose isomerase-like protein (cupin superfamily)
VKEMKKFRIEDFVKMENPNPGARIKQEILTNEHKAKDLGGIFGLLPPGSQVPCHFHRMRESLIIAISGEATEIIENKEIPFKTNDVLYIPAGERHMTMNRTDKDFRYLEFFTFPPATADLIEVN